MRRIAFVRLYAELELSSKVEKYNPFCQIYDRARDNTH